LNPRSYALLELWSWDKPVDKSLVSEESLVNKQYAFVKKEKAASLSTGGFLNSLKIKLFRRKQKR
jgi:hypothetical protein